MIWLARFWKPLGAVLAVAVIYGYGYLKGMQAEQASWQEARLKQAEHNIALNNEVSDELQTNHGITRSQYDAVLLRATGRVLITDTPGRCDETARNHGISGDVGQNVTKLMRDAQLQTQQLKACQDWIKRLKQ